MNISYPKIELFFYILIFNLLTTITVNAATFPVNSITELKNAISNSKAGDVITLADGEYLNTSLTISKSNITIKAATPGGVFLNGTNDININGNYITFSGFQFTSGDIGTSYVIEVYGSYNLITQLNFSGYFAKKYIEVKAGTQYNEISYCNIEKKPATAASGCTIQISTSATIPGYHKISYCLFQNYEGIGGDFGNEPVRIGLGAEYLNKSRTIVEHCYFNNTGLGDSESISVKCQENVIRFCSFTNQQNAMLCFRNGDNNVAYSNFFINAGGIRVKEANNIFCYNNYFENSVDAITYVYVATLVPPTTASPRTLNLNNINFIHNTFYNCGTIDMGGTGATNNTWANNIFQNSTGAMFSNPNSGTTWVGNIYQGTLGIKIASGMEDKDPLLITNSDGYKGLSAGSPAIDAANSNYPAILDIPLTDDDPNLLFDTGRKSRPTTITLKDVGSDEFTTGVTTNHPLKLSEVGPSYLVVPLSVNTNELSGNKNTITIFPNPSSTSFSIENSSNAGELLKVAIYNLNGQLVKKDSDFHKKSSTNQNNQYDVSDLNNGIYFVKVASESDSRTLKLIIKR